MYVPVGTQNNSHELYLRMYSKIQQDFNATRAGDRSAMLSLFEGGVSANAAQQRDSVANNVRTRNYLPSDLSNYLSTNLPIYRSVYISVNLSTYR